MTQIYTGRQDATSPPFGSGATRRVEYESRDVTTWTTVPGSSATTVTIATSSFLSGDGYVTVLRYVYQNLPAGFSMLEDAGASAYSATVLAVDRTDATVTNGTVITNTGTWTYSNTAGTTVMATSNRNVTVAREEARPRLDKSVISGSTVAPLGTTRYQLSLSNLAAATGPLVDPVVADLLDPALTYNSNSWSQGLTCQTRRASASQPLRSPTTIGARVAPC